MPARLTQGARDLAGALEQRLSRALEKFPKDASGWVLNLPAPTLLGARAAQLSTIFEEGTPPEPPSQARINALDRLRQGKLSLTRKDWALIGWGLCDDCGRAGRPIETDSMFGQIMAYIKPQIALGLSRKLFFGLLHSYFAYGADAPEGNPNWLALRATLAAILPTLTSGQTRPKVWARVLTSQQELLTPQAGRALGAALLAGDETVRADIATHLPIPETSWLWRRVIAAQLDLIDAVDDAEFRLAIPAMLKLAVQHSHQADLILSRLLTRYERCEFRDEPDAALKQFALDRWQNPQIKSSNRWSLVSDAVRKMILHWFAKADLQHFFSLLQGDGSVDHDRLHYWLRFVDQISYTRIVMGGDAFVNDSNDFIDFREKNQGRFSRLSASDTTNNAFVMQIGDYHFVEFSGTGNACYIYANSKLPFSPEKKLFQLLDLKARSHVIDRIIHNGDWCPRADRLLRNLGIVPNAAVTKIKPTVVVRPIPVAAAPISATSRNSIVQGSPNTSPNKLDIHTLKNSADIENTPAWSSSPKTLQLIAEATRIARENKLATEDHRAKGGAYWVLENGLHANIRQQLVRLGFSYVARRGYWVK